MQKKSSSLAIIILALLYSACTQNIKVSTQTPICGKDTMYENIKVYVQENSGIDSILVNQIQKRKLVNPTIGLDYDIQIKEGDSLTICFGNVRKTLKDINHKYPNCIIERLSSAQLNVAYKCEMLIWD